MRFKLVIAYAVVAAVFILSCSKTVQQQMLPEVNPEFGAYVSAYTTGAISKKSKIRIRLTADYDKNVKLNEPVSEELFSFSPSIKGKTYWLDKRTIEFVPDKELTSGTVYEAHFNLG